MNANERQAARALLLARGVTGPVRFAKQMSEDELVIVLPSSVAARVDMRLEQDLQNLLHRNVWIVEDSPSWRDTEEL